MAAAPRGEMRLARATQGHRYHWHGLNVLAMESGTDQVRVCEIGPLWLGASQLAPVAELEPQPMGYFRGEVPA